MLPNPRQSQRGPQMIQTLVVTDNKQANDNNINRDIHHNNTNNMYIYIYIYTCKTMSFLVRHERQPGQGLLAEASIVIYKCT